MRIHDYDLLDLTATFWLTSSIDVRAQGAGLLSVVTSTFVGQLAFLRSAALRGSPICPLFGRLDVYLGSFRTVVDGLVNASR